MAGHAALLAVVAVMVVACSNPPSPTAGVSLSPSPAPAASSASFPNGGCGNTPIHKGGIPAWATENAPASLPYVVATPDIAMGYLFTDPLRTGQDMNKILWYVRAPRDGSTLTAEGHPLGSSGPIARFSSLDNSGPGEIYPSGPSVPTAGCWHFTLSWHGNVATVDLLFE